MRAFFQDYGWISLDDYVDLAYVGREKKMTKEELRERVKKEWDKVPKQETKNLNFDNWEIK